MVEGRREGEGLLAGLSFQQTAHVVVCNPDGAPLFRGDVLQGQIHPGNEDDKDLANTFRGIQGGEGVWIVKKCDIIDRSLEH